MYEDIEIFEELYNICILVYDIENASLIISKKAHMIIYKMILYIYLIKYYHMNADDLGQKHSHYVYIKEFRAYFEIGGIPNYSEKDHRYCLM